MISLTKSKKSKAKKTHKYITREKTTSGAWRYIYETVKHDLTRTKEQRRKEREEKKKKPATPHQGLQNAKTGYTLTNMVFRKKGESKWDKDKQLYLKKCINDAKSYVKDWYKKPQDDIYNQSIKDKATLKLIKHAKKLKDLIFKI